MVHKTFYQNSNTFTYRCDASPSYLYFHRKTSQRILKDTEEQANKFIIIFRNPIDRAYSHYWHNVHRGLHENLSFENAILAEENRLITKNKELNDFGRIRYSYFQAGLYAEQLKTFWMTFPRENFFLLFQEDLHSTRFTTTLNLIQDFLQLPRLSINYQHSNPSYKLLNRKFSETVRKPSFIKSVLKSFVPQNIRTPIKLFLLKLNTTNSKYPSMNPETRQKLIEKFKPSILEFEKLIEKDLSNWLK